MSAAFYVLIHSASLTYFPTILDITGWYDIGTNCTKREQGACNCANGGTCTDNGNCVCFGGFTGELFLCGNLLDN